jgi:hypothetical protein
MIHKQIKLFAVIVIALAQMVFGQITFETKITSNGFMGMGAFKSTTKTYLIKDAQKTETKLKFTGALMKMFSPKGTTSNIIRLDKELIWAFDDRKKKYTEQTFEEIKGMMQLGGEYKSQQMPEQDEDYESEYEWKKPAVKVKNLKESKTINGFNCQHYLASVTTVGTHKESGIKDTMLFVSDMWNAKDVSKKMELVYDFNKRYMDAIGFDVPENQGLAMITGMYKEQMQTLTDEVSKLQGYPIINDMKLTMTKNLLSVKQDEEAEEPEEESISLRDIKKNFGGLLGKKIMKDVVDKKAEQSKQSSVSELFRMTSEVLSINEGSIAGEVFEVKKGYKLKKN